MITAIVVGSAVVGFFLGYFISAFLIARDPDIVRIGEDEVIVKRPAPGLILVAVTQQVARRIVLQGSESHEKSVIEARDLLGE